VLGAMQPLTPLSCCSYTDLHELGSESAVKAAGKYRQQGKEYLVGDGDIIYFKVGVMEMSLLSVLTLVQQPWCLSATHSFSLGFQVWNVPPSQFNVTSSGKK
jgi:hypothetical protein